MISLLSALRLLVAAIGLAQFVLVAAGLPPGHAGLPRPAETRLDPAADTARVAILTAPPVVLAAAKPDLAQPGAAILPRSLSVAPTTDELAVLQAASRQNGAAARLKVLPPARGPPLA